MPRLLLSSLRSSPLRTYCFSRCSSTFAAPADDYADTPEYPQIVDPSKEAQKRREAEQWYKYIEELPTVEQKQNEICDRWYYGYFCHRLISDMPTYNSLPFIQYVTRTSFVESLPAVYDTIDVDHYFASIKQQLLRAVELNFDKTRRWTDEPRNVRFRNKNLIRQITRIILRNLHQYQHLKEAEVDLEPRIESFWGCGGFPLQKQQKQFKLRRQRGQHQLDMDVFYKHLERQAHEKERQFIHEHEAYKKELEKEEVNKWFQYMNNNSILNVCCKHPLPVFHTETDQINSTHPRPQSWFYDPIVLSTYNEGRRNPTNIPGFWVGRDNEWGLVGFVNRSTLSLRESKFDFSSDSEARQDNTHAHGILNSFGWVIAQANHQGFTMFNDITYPLTTQMILTDGQIWSFYTYQLNTMKFHDDIVHSNSKENICWGSKEMKLYEGIENGKLVGVNDDVLRLLLKYFVLQPEERVGVELRPYLGKQRSILNDKNEEFRTKVMYDYKYLAANRPRHIPIPEIYDWEFIYKIKNKTRPMDARRRFFELYKVRNKPTKEKLAEKKVLRS